MVRSQATVVRNAGGVVEEPEERDALGLRQIGSPARQSVVQAQAPSSRSWSTSTAMKVFVML
jgi:hypothetical protein